MSFSSDMNDAAKKIIEAHDKIARAATLELFSGVVKSTPVDTGRARGNWQTSVSAPAEGITDREDKGGSKAIAEVNANTPEGAGQETFLSNNLPYIEILEHGGSKQAPAGMVAVNFARVVQIVQKAISRLKV
ncbi:hypothetical protein D9M71_34000 [compost metagenome]